MKNKSVILWIVLFIFGNINQVLSEQLERPISTLDWSHPLTVLDSEIFRAIDVANADFIENSNKRNYAIIVYSDNDVYRVVFKGQTNEITRTRPYPVCYWVTKIEYKIINKKIIKPF